MKPTPRLDSRTKADLANQLQQLLVKYVKDWPKDRIPEGNFAALTNVFIRFCEITIQHLNRVPDKNFLAFLDLLGAAPLSPQSARVPLTFSLAAGSSLALVSAGTQVSASPALGDDQPVIYETEEPLVVTAVRLMAVFGRDLAKDLYKDYQSAIDPNLNSVEVFQCDKQIPHRFYIAHDRLFHLPGLTKIRLQINLQSAIPTSPENPRDRRSLKWEYWNGQEYTELRTEKDDTNALTQQSGEIIIPLTNPLQDTTVNGLKHPWLRCSLNESITLVETPTPGMVRHRQLPRITSMKVKVRVVRPNLRLDAAFVNQSPVDINAPFAPFGPIPKVGDVLYLACREGFSQKDSTIVLTLDVGSVNAIGDEILRLQWEFWNGEQWQSLNVKIRDGINNLTDTTNAFTVAGDGKIEFTIPTQPKAITINGLENFWVRVRIAAGGYGQVASLMPGTERDNEKRQIIDYVPATLAPPLLNTIIIYCGFTTPSDSSEDLEQSENLEQIQIENHRTYRGLSSIPAGGFSPFETVLEGRSRSAHFGFQLPPDLSLQNRLLSLFRFSQISRGRH